MKISLGPAAAGALLLVACAAVQASTTCFDFRSVGYGTSKVQQHFDKLDGEHRWWSHKNLSEDHSGGNVCWEVRHELNQLYCDKYWSGALSPGHIYTSHASRMVWNETPEADLGTRWPQWRGIKGYIVRAQKWFDIYVYNTWAAPGGRVRGKVDGGVVASMPGEMIGACWKTKTYVAYLNGILTTQPQAADGLDALEAEFGDTYRDTPLVYQLLHNQTACDGNSGGSCLGDLAEVFAQRQSLLSASLANRWEVFWEIVSERDEDRSVFTKDLKSRLGSLFSDFVADVSASIRNKALQSLVAMFAKPAGAEDGETFVSQLVKNAEDNRSATVVVAHSQGNLFTKELKEKYEASMKRKSSNPFPPATFVHVAPPTKSLVGPYVLADIDLVIRGLGALTDGSTPSTNVALPFSTSDLLGHGFVETYWDKSRPAYGVVRRLVENFIASH